MIEFSQTKKNGHHLANQHLFPTDHPTRMRFSYTKNRSRAPFEKENAFQNRHEHRQTHTHTHIHLHHVLCAAHLPAHDREFNTAVYYILSLARRSNGMRDTYIRYYMVYGDVSPLLKVWQGYRIFFFYSLSFFPFFLQ